MKAIMQIAVAAAFLTGLQATPSFAQSTGTDTAPAPAAASPAPAPAATPTPAASPATPAPTAAAPTSPPPAAETDSAAPSDKAATKESTPKRKKRRMTRQQEIDHSIDNGTVPSRYRSQVPREYQKYIPFEK